MNYSKSLTKYQSRYYHDLLSLWGSQNEVVAFLIVQFLCLTPGKNIITDHRRPVTSLTLSEDGALLASCSDFNEILIHDVETGNLQQILKGDKIWVTNLSLTKNNEYLISTSCDETIHVWEIETGEILYKLNGHTEAVLCCSLFSDDTHFASGSLDGSLILWKMFDFENKIFLRKPGVRRQDIMPIECLTITRDDNWLICGICNEGFQLWNIKNQIYEFLFDGHSGNMSCCEIDRKQKYLLTSSSDGLVKIWDFKNRILLHNFDDDFHSVCRMSSSGKFFLLTSSTDNSCNIIDTETGETIQKLGGIDHDDGIFTCCKISPNDEFLITCCEKFIVKLWTGPHSICVKSFKYKSHLPFNCFFSSQSSFFVAIKEETKISLSNWH